MILSKVTYESKQTVQEQSARPDVVVKDDDDDDDDRDRVRSWYERETEKQRGRNTKHSLIGVFVAAW